METVMDDDDLFKRIASYDLGPRRLTGHGTTKNTWLDWDGIQNLTVLDLHQSFLEQHRILILAPHPDDEVLGCAGLMQKLHTLGREIVLIAITNGTASHPKSMRYTPEQLNKIRPQESRQALAVLNLEQIQRIEFNIPDGQVAAYALQLKNQLERLIRPQDILITTHEQDGHPDHEISAYVIRHVAKKHDLKHLQVFVWTWHWAQPEQAEISWDKVRRLDLSKNELLFKEQAIRCFQSQITVDDSTGAPAILPEYAIQRILMPYEVYLDEN